MGRLSSLEVLDGQIGELEVGRIPDRRDVAEALRERMDLLGETDRLLLKIYLEAGSSFDEIARLTGLSRSTVCRRVHRLVQRLSDETYVRCEGSPESFPETELAVIRDYFVCGLSMPRICRQRRLCRYRVRTIVRKARQFVRTAEAVCQKTRNAKPEIRDKHECSKS